MLEKLKYYIEHYKQYRYIAAGIVILIIALLFFIQPKQPENEVQEKNTTEWNHKDNLKNGDNKLQSAKKDTQETQNTKSKKVMVDVKGAVKHPNVYEMSNNQRIKDVVLKAVPTDKADLNQINLSEKLVDQKLIYIPEKGKNGSNNLVSVNSGTSDNSSTTQQKVNLNTAKETELTTVTGVGPSKAKAIIEFRESKGSFDKVEQLKEVKGIGEKSFEKLKDYFTI
ncbi:helix-hairpin-helix domain-containing protein [Staphylococcus debuckii]|uniref:helix-hairpin-helix domain-containing protein n=1 Tax=Staphylococcus debuckii TaxID=2044912 RepID=UPI000F4333D0|nr:helix-hairpin-helix domain-containing protein [Staphylococcus debuckii]AYU55378.1 comEA protein [Staphylococcus debuckii]